LLTEKRATVVLESRAGIDPAVEILNLRPVLVADFKDAKPNSYGGSFWLQLGVRNCPVDTRQIVFTTDDGRLIDAAASLQNSLCMVVRPSPDPSRLVWSDYGDFRVTDRDHRLFAIGIKTDGKPHSVSDSQAVAQAVAELRNPFILQKRGKNESPLKLLSFGVRRPSLAEFAKYPIDCCRLGALFRTALFPDRQRRCWRTARSNDAIQLAHRREGSLDG
jgi:hypothetical protein